MISKILLGHCTIGLSKENEGEVALMSICLLMLLIECLSGSGSNAAVCNLYDLHLQNLFFKFEMFLCLLPNKLSIFYYLIPSLSLPDFLFYCCRMLSRKESCSVVKLSLGV